MGAINDPFARCGVHAKTKLLHLGSPAFLPEDLMNRIRSLNIEHVSPTTLTRSEISHVSRASSPAGLRPASAAAKEAAILAVMRKWFFTRKPDAGYVLTDFPATLLQAQVFDEWLDARDECLDGVFTGPGSNESVVVHYRTLGLLVETDALAA